MPIAEAKVSSCLFAPSPFIKGPREALFHH